MGKTVGEQKGKASSRSVHKRRDSMKGKLLVVLALGFWLSANAQTYTAVTDARLVNPEPSNWLMWRGNYQSWGYSPLSRINLQNVNRLVPVWAFSTGVGQGHEAPPIVNGNYMFVTAPYNKLFALDARNGRLIWKYERQLPDDVVTCCDVVNRGVALYGDKVYMGTLDAHLIAFDARTGKIVWDVTVADYKLRYTITSPPLVVKGKVITGVHGGEFGVRGFLAAYDANTGRELWKTYTTVDDGSWPGESWKTGGAAPWLTGSYDPGTNTVFWGTSNPSPWIDMARDPKQHDLRWSSSVIALDPDTGRIKSAFQYSPNDAWDYDGVNEKILINVEGQPTLVSAHRNGWLYKLDRRGGNLRFLGAYKYAFSNAYKGIDARGRPIWDPERRPDIGKTVNACPAFLGAKNWNPGAYSPQTRLVYFATNDWCMDIRGAQVEYVPGEAFVGAEFEMKTVPGFNHVGALRAIDPANGKIAWEYKFRAPLWGGVLATAGGLIFTGSLDDRGFHAFDARTGKRVWSFTTNSGVIGVPMSYEVGGVQYIAVYSGFGGAIPLWAGPVAKLTKDVPMGGVLWVFALK